MQVADGGRVVVRVRYRDMSADACAIAQALGVVGDWWTLLIIRDIAGGHHRFESLQRELGLSRKVLSARLRDLIEHGVITTRRYCHRPARHEYVLTDAGVGLLPVLIALQNWGGQFVLGDGELTATTRPGSIEARRVHSLVGSSVPELTLPAVGDAAVDPVAASRWTVLYAYPGAYAPSDRYPPGWGTIPGAKGCTLEARTYRDRLDDFTSRDATVYGVSTQRLDQLAGFAEHESVQYPLLSDADAVLATALRLPTFRIAGTDRLKRVTLIIDAHRTIQAVIYPVIDPAASVQDALDLIGQLDMTSATPAEQGAST